MEVASEIPSNKDYYDGTKTKLNMKSCSQYNANKNTCLKSNSCGWCSSTKSCIPGNAKGPLASCLKGRFEFGGVVNNKKTKHVSPAYMNPFSFF